MCDQAGDAPTLAPDLLAPPFADGRPELLDLLPPLLAPEAPAGQDLVVLLDGVGSLLLEEHMALTPTLRRLAGNIRTVRTVVPATTASAMVSILTGEAPLVHGVLGYETLHPAGGAAVNQLRGDSRISPEDWMSRPTLGQRSRRRLIHVGPGKHRGSFLTRMAFRGWEFMEQENRGARVGTVVRALRRAGPDGLVHLHIDDVDRAGHRHGVHSGAWRDALAEADAVVGALLRRLPKGTRVHLTADHGMVDTSPTRTIDLAREAGLARRITALAGEPRARMLRVARGSGTIAGFAEELRAHLGECAVVLERQQILDAGLLGPVGTPVPDQVRGRIGDVMVLARGTHAVVDTRFQRPDVTPEIGVHGSPTAAEMLVPLLRVET